MEPEPKYQAPAPPSKSFGSSHPKSLGLRLHSPAGLDYYRLLQAECRKIIEMDKKRVTL